MGAELIATASGTFRTQALKLMISVKRAKRTSWLGAPRSENDSIRTLTRQRVLELHLHNCEAFVRKRRACRSPNGSSRREPTIGGEVILLQPGPSPRRMSEPVFAPSGRVVPRPA